MKQNKDITWFILGGIAFAIVLLWFFVLSPLLGDFFDFITPVVENHFESMDDIYVQDFDEKGWLTEFMPDSANDIYVRNNLDINISWQRFTILEDDLDGFTSNLEKVNYLEDQSIKFGGPAKRIKWWDHEITIKNAEKDNFPYEFYKHIDADGYTRVFAINKETLVVYVFLY